MTDVMLREKCAIIVTHCNADSHRDGVTRNTIVAILGPELPNNNNKTFCCAPHLLSSNSKVWDFSVLFAGTMRTKAFCPPCRNAADSSMHTSCLSKQQIVAVCIHGRLAGGGGSSNLGVKGTPITHLSDHSQSATDATHRGLALTRCLTCFYGTCPCLKMNLVQMDAAEYPLPESSCQICVKKNRNWANRLFREKSVGRI